MTKIHKKLLVFFSVLVCSLCLVFGIAACSGGGHTHTFGGFWLFDGADGHYRLATCHPEVKSTLEPHVDENDDFNCDVCGYVMHVHVDENEDGICDDCQTELHKHTFEEQWSFNEKKHWHEASCEHFIERSDYADHDFTAGNVCECGIKKSASQVYELYKNSPEYDLEFIDWLAWLADNDIIEVEYTEGGDGIYHYADGTSEVRFLGEKTVKVKAQSGGEPLSDVWFMVTLYTGSKYYESNGTIALGIAKTDESGIAEISFNPVGGYSSTSVQYRIRVALAADVAVALGTKEENAKPVPNRYVATKNTEYFPYEVNENSNAEDIAATVDFTFSKGWNAYDTIELPYKRYYQDLINGENIKEEGTTYAFTTSGNDLFDYFIFEPAKYSLKDSGSLEDSAKIEENAKQAASGIYKIYFTYQGNANVTLYYWNEQGVNMSASHQTKADGTPSDEYITSVSGGTADEGKYTGGSFVNVTVTPTNGLRQYQFGIIADKAVKVTITVERVDDFVIPENPEITVGDNDNIVLLGNGATAALILQNVPAGYYYLTINTPDDVEKQSGLFSAYVDPSCVSSLWDGMSQFKGIIEIPTGTPFLYICNYYSAEGEEFITVSVNLSVYVPPVVKLGEEISVPISGMGLDNGIEIPLDESVTSGKYYFELTLAGGQALSGASWYVRVLVGDNDYSFSLPTSTSSSEIISAYIDVNAGDKLSIFILGGSKYSSAILSGKLKLTESGWTSVQLGETVNANYDTKSVKDNEKYFTFTASKSGTYKLSLTLLNAAEVVNNRDLYYLQVENYVTEEIIVNRGTFAGTTGIPNIQSSGTFELNEGETITLKFNRLLATALLNIDFIIEYVEG